MVLADIWSGIYVCMHCVIPRILIRSYAIIMRKSHNNIRTCIAVNKDAHNCVRAYVLI